MTDFKQLMNTPAYDFLRTNERLGKRIILLGLGGSHAYGTNNENSDIDFRGITLNMPSDLIGMTEFEQYEDSDTDTVIYAFNKMVRVLHAVESGSRAWGFASPDSDYDVRFIYVRNSDDYLRLDEIRDVIEWQLDEVLDINGWDLKKALVHFRRGNATLFEWSNSPVVYQTTALWEHIYNLTRQYFSVKAAANNYYGTANSTYMHYLQGDTANYKKYFYALRPLLAGRYIQVFHSAPPVLFDELMKMEIPAELRAGIEELLELKKHSDESSEGAQIPVIRDFIVTELEAQKANLEQTIDDRNRDWGPLNELFREALSPPIRSILKS